MIGTPMTRPLGGLIGRDRELAALTDCLEAARDGRPSTVLIGGDAGIGKTRLVTELLSRSSERALWGGCLPLGERGVPYLAVIEMLRSLDTDEKALLPAALRFLTPGSPQAADERAISQMHLFQSVLEFYEELASRDPLVLVVEDLHWADRSTRDLLDFLIGFLRHQQILLVASFRSDDLASDHPLRSQLAEWLRRPSVTRLDLEPLSREEALRLIAPLLSGSDVTPAQAIRLVERGDGNPFFLEELAAGGDVHGTPGRMRDLLLRRTHDLSPQVMRLLRIASAGGATIDEDLLIQVAGLDADEIRALLRVGIDTQLLTVDGRGCRFRHALLAEALHDDLLPAERREYHGAYADALGARPGVSPAELAAHQTEAGRLEDALASWVAAGETAETQFAFSEARDAYQAALDGWGDATDPETVAGLSHLDLLRRLAEAAFLSGDARTACDRVRQALAEIDPEDDPLMAGLTYHRLARYLRNTDELGEALAIQQQAVNLVPSSPPSTERAEVLSGLALILQFENRYQEARELSLEAIEVAVETEALDAEIRARNTLGETVCILDDLDRGLAIIGEAHDLAQRSGNAHEQARSLWNMQANRFFGGRMSDFVDNSAATIATLRITQPHWILDHMVDTADALQMLGRWDEADAMIEAARRGYPTLTDRIGIREVHVARREYGEARAMVEAQEELLVGYFGPDVTGRVLNLVNRAAIELAEGNVSEAIELVDHALERYPSLDKPIYISHGIALGLRAAADLARSARIGGDSRELEKAIEIGERFHEEMTVKMSLPGPEDGWRREVGCLAAQCEAERRRLHGEPDPAAWLEAGRRWLDLSMPYRAAYPRLRWVEDALATGSDRAEVTPVVVELLELSTRLDARQLEDEVKALARRARIDIGDRFSHDRYGLTNREREVLARLAKGATNRRIAEALYISERTASVHVSNILRKLAVANRGEAAATAIREGLVELTELGQGT